MCNILKTADRRVMAVLGTAYIGYFSCLILCSVWDHSVHFAKFLMLRFSKDYCQSHTFHSISTKLFIVSMLVMRKCRLLLFWQSALLAIWHFESFVNTGPYGAEISKCYFPSVDLI